MTSPPPTPICPDLRMPVPSSLLLPLTFLVSHADAVHLCRRDADAPASGTLALVQTTQAQAAGAGRRGSQQQTETGGLWPVVLMPGAARQ
jgi:hypothetical protein